MTLSALHTDLGSPDAYIHGVPHEVFADLRRHEPVAWIEEPAGEGFAGGPGFWAVTRYDDVMTVSKNPDIFSSHKGTSFLRDQRPQDLAALQQMMLNLDPGPLADAVDRQQGVHPEDGARDVRQHR